MCVSGVGSLESETSQTQTDRRSDDNNRTTGYDTTVTDLPTAPKGRTETCNFHLVL